MTPTKRVRATCSACGQQKPGEELRMVDGKIVCDPCLTKRGEQRRRDEEGRAMALAARAAGEW